MTQVVINPGTGPIAGSHARDARRNLGVFCRDLALPAPRISIARNVSGDFDGKYDYLLQRGIRTVSVAMPGLPLDRVKLGPSDNAWHFHRLYVDGDSWLWPFALDTAKRALLDHDGSAERGYHRSLADCAFVLAHEPRCAICNSIKDRYCTDTKTENPPYGYDRLRCLTCVPIEKTEIRSWNLEALYVDDSWKTLQHGCVYRVTSRCVPYEALGTADDPICTIGCYFSGRPCLRRQGHAGDCKPPWQEIKRERIELPYREVP